MAKSTAGRRSAHSVPRPAPPTFAELLEEAVNKPGVISQAYFHFHAYSFQNQLLALLECWRRGIEPGPIHTFGGWLKLNRAVRRGEKAITLCMPVSWAAKVEPTKRADDASVNDSREPKSEDARQSTERSITRRRFVFRPNWFVLSQTDGEPIPQLSIPTWDESLALASLGIEKIPFSMTSGNVQGYAQGRQVAVSPIAHLPHRTLIHEIAHVVLGHTAEVVSLIDHAEATPRDVREVEAEGVAYIVTQSLGLPGEEFSRGYLQHWLNRCTGGEKKIDERSAQKIFHAADTILKAGRARPVAESSDSAD
jgi:antirestriction protein ArdC